MTTKEVRSHSPRTANFTLRSREITAIHDIFASNAQQHPEAPCVIETCGPRNPERQFTYKHINQSSNQLAHFFLAHGCERGDVIMIYAHRRLVNIFVTFPYFNSRSATMGCYSIGDIRFQSSFVCKEEVRQTRLIEILRSWILTGSLTALKRHGLPQILPYTKLREQ